MKLILLLIAFILIAITACEPISRHLPLSQVAFTENYVDVTIRLDKNESGGYSLSATFIPPQGFHLYSKDIPLNGINGLGRPTLLILSSDSQLKAIGKIRESVKAEEPNFEPKELFVYPAGAVTLSLSVSLPAGIGWVKTEVRVSYMACSESTCKPPVVGKVVSISIPSANVIR